MQDENCIFCQIAQGKAPTNKVYENDYVIAFDDLHPLMPVHTLIIPKDHYRNIIDDVPAEVLGQVFAAVKEVARIKGVDESGFRILVNTGKDASPTVPHFHVHILGGGPMPRPNDQDWGPAASNAQ
ncbi:MAG: HIT domain-containing protein [Eggerthellaceae bacterium]|jgi:histidine triad (HIT) family protein